MIFSEESVVTSSTIIRSKLEIERSPCTSKLSNLFGSIKNKQFSSTSRFQFTSELFPFFLAASYFENLKFCLPLNRSSISFMIYSPLQLLLGRIRIFNLSLKGIPAWYADSIMKRMLLLELRDFIDGVRKPFGVSGSVSYFPFYD